MNGFLIIFIIVISFATQLIESSNKRKLKKIAENLENKIGRKIDIL